MLSLKRTGLYSLMLGMQHIPIDSIIGFDGRDAIVEDVFNEVCANKPTQLTPECLMSSMEFAYCLGTILRLLVFFRSNAKGVILFDDDILVSKNPEDSMNFAGHLERFDILFLGASQHSWESIPAPPGKVYMPNRNTYGTFAIYLKRDAAYQYLLALLEMKDAADRYPLKKLLHSSDLKSAVAFPNICIANVSRSLIRQPRDIIEHSRCMGWDLARYKEFFACKDD